MDENNWKTCMCITLSSCRCWCRSRATKASMRCWDAVNNFAGGRGGVCKATETVNFTVSTI